MNTKRLQLSVSPCCFPTVDNCVMEPFHSSASFINPERSRFHCIFLLHIRIKYMKTKTVFVRRSSMFATGSLCSRPVCVFLLTSPVSHLLQWNSVGYAPLLHHHGHFSHPLIPHFCAVYFHHIPIWQRELHLPPHQPSEASRGTPARTCSHTLSEV